MLFRSLLASRLDTLEGLERREPVDLLALAAEECARTGAALEGETTTMEGDPRLLRRLLSQDSRPGQRKSTTLRFLKGRGVCAPSGNA